jgi:hypothetical protein
MDFQGTYTNLLLGDSPIDSIAMYVPVEPSQSKPPKELQTSHRMKISNFAYLGRA